MSNTRNIRRRIKSVKNTSQITKAMQMVAASKMKKAQQVALAGHPYAEQMNRLLLSLNQAVEKPSHPFLVQREQHNTPGVLLISTDKGLCGALNSNLFREALKLPETTKFISIGKKGRQFLTRSKRNMVADFEFKDSPTMLQLKKISQYMIDLFMQGEIDSINVLYPRFVNTLVQEPVLSQILPIEEFSTLRAKVRNGSNVAKSDSDTHVPIEFLYEPHASVVLDKLLPYYVHFEVYQMFLDARASEHSARMVAMKSATDNAKALVKELTLEYNKARQADITSQILEISTAQMSLNG